MYRAVTRKIEVTVTPRFLADRSSPDKSYYFWAHTIAITNSGDQTVQLQHTALAHHRRHGPHAGGQRYGRCGRRAGPEGRPAFEYTSGVPLQTPSGFMTGTYGMETESRRAFRRRDPDILPRQLLRGAHHQLTQELAANWTRPAVGTIRR